MAYRDGPLRSQLCGRPQGNNSNLLCLPHSKQSWRSPGLPLGWGVGGLCLAQKSEALHVTLTMTEQLSAGGWLAVSCGISVFQTLTLGWRGRWEKAGQG